MAIRFTLITALHVGQTWRQERSLTLKIFLCPITQPKLLSQKSKTHPPGWFYVPRHPPASLFCRFHPECCPPAAAVAGAAPAVEQPSHAAAAAQPRRLHSAHSGAACQPGLPSRAQPNSPPATAAVPEMDHDHDYFSSEFGLTWLTWPPSVSVALSLHPQRRRTHLQCLHDEPLATKNPQSIGQIFQGGNRPTRQGGRIFSHVCRSGLRDDLPRPTFHSVADSEPWQSGLAPDGAAKGRLAPCSQRDSRRSFLSLSFCLDTWAK